MLKSTMPNFTVDMDRPLTTLELTAMGIILKRGPCVAHAVVSEFGSSRTSAYRSGAGSIYPLLKRLGKAGLLAEQSRLYTITEAGREAMRSWLKGPFEPADFSTSLDELRSRAYFLKLLSREEAEHFVDECVTGLSELLDRCKDVLAHFRQSGDRFSEIAVLGSVRETEARLGWMLEMQQAFRADEFWTTVEPPAR